MCLVFGPAFVRTLQMFILMTDRSMLIMPATAGNGRVGGVPTTGQ